MLSRLSLLVLLALGASSRFTKAEEAGNTSANSQRLSDLVKSRGKTNKGDADNDLSPEELHDKQLKKMKESQEKANKVAEEKAKKDKKKDTEKKSEPDPTALKALPKKNAKVVELEPLKDGKDKNRAEVIKGGAANSDIIELGGPKNTKQRGNTVSIGDRVSGTALGTGDINALSIKEPPAEKHGFFDRLFGHDKKPPPAPKAAKKGEDLRIASVPTKKGAPSDPNRFMAAPQDRRDTLSHKVQEQMAIKRLEGESKEREKDPSGEPAEKKAEVVDVTAGATTPTPANDSDIADKSNPSQPAEKTEKAPLTEEQTKAALEAQYRAGLASKDVVAREASFQRAAMERREDAIPFLLEELRQDNFLAAVAAQCLGAIGRVNDEIESTLVRNLASFRVQIRQVCAESLGRLQSRRSVQPIIEVFKTEKSYPAREAYLEALGSIGERNAIPFLKSVLEQKDEIEIVKSRAALALARMNDPSGRAHLIRNVDSPLAAQQVLGIMGLAQLREPFVAGYLNKALESQFEEVWTTAVYLFPMLGPQALPVLRTRLDSPSETMRIRAAMAIGFLGSDEAMPVIDRALRVGTVDARVMGCELIGNLARRDRVPLLIERLQDPNTNVRQTAAVALTRLNATESLPALMEVSRGARMQDLPPGLRGAGPDVMERLVILSCVRILRGEKDDLVITSLPNSHDNSWPEFDRVMTGQRKELVKLYQVVDVIVADGRALGVVLKVPDGKEIMFREGEPVASGFKVREIGLPIQGKDKAKLPPYVILMSGDERITLTAGKPAEEDSVKPKK